jgi:hypothetical protein
MGSDGPRGDATHDAGSPCDLSDLRYSTLHTVQYSRCGRPERECRVVAACQSRRVVKWLTMGEGHSLRPARITDLGPVVWRSEWQLVRVNVALCPCDRPETVR